MVNLIPLPYLLTMVYALFVPNGKNRHVGYVGSVAGLATLVLAWLSWNMPTESLAWFSVGGVTMELSFLTDQLALVLAGVVGGIGMFVFLYSVGYFEQGEDLRRYYFFLALFATSMLVVVLAANLFLLFFAWELVGISSYFLIGFWHHKKEAVLAARKAILTIVLGDAFLLAGILLLWYNYNTLDIPTILSSLRADNLTLLAGIGVIVGGISKSAQFPLHDWLPDAMEGPTPVSAFLHSATMVKAGLFLIARFLPVLVLVGLTPWLVVIAIITILISALMALTENDIKRVLAYSTMNQLAFILLALGVGAVTAGMFHLVTHSAFKALLFFSAGVAIHAAGTQDLKAMKITPKKDVFTISTIIGALALAGLVPLSGFFSKDAIYEHVLHAGSVEVILVFSVAIVLSAAYIARWLFLLFAKGKDTHSSWESWLPMAVLAVLSAGLGLAVGPFFHFWHEHVPSYLTLSALVSTVLVLLGGYLAYLHHKGRMEWLSNSVFAEACRERFLLDRLGMALGRLVQGIGNLAGRFDDVVINRTSRGIALLTVAFGKGLRRLQTGSAPSYVAIMILGFVIIVLALGVFA